MKLRSLKLSTLSAIDFNYVWTKTERKQVFSSKSQFKKFLSADPYLWHSFVFTLWNRVTSICKQLPGSNMGPQFVALPYYGMGFCTLPISLKKILHTLLLIIIHYLNLTKPWVVGWCSCPPWRRSGWRGCCATGSTAVAGSPPPQYPRLSSLVIYTC